MDDPMMMSFKRNSKTAGSDNSSNDNNGKDNLSNRNMGATGEEMDMQMLRGIFAAFDDNKNGKLPNIATMSHASVENKKVCLRFNLNSLSKFVTLIVSSFLLYLTSLL